MLKCFGVKMTHPAVSMWRVGTTFFFIFFFSVSGIAAQCNGATRVLRADTTERYITSPNFPNNYPSKAVCEWLLESSMGSDYFLKVEAVSMDLELHVDCVYDFVAVYNGKTAIQGRRYCGGTFTARSTGRYLLVLFQSDGNQEHSGFKLKYYAQAFVTLTPVVHTQPTTSPPDTGAKKGGDWLNTGALIGGVVGGVLGVILLGVLCGRCLGSNGPRQPPVHRPAAFYHSHAPPSEPPSFASAVHMVQNNNSVFMVSQALQGNISPTHLTSHLRGAGIGVNNEAFDPAGEGLAAEGFPPDDVIGPPIGVPPPTYTESMLVTNPPSIPSPRHGAPSSVTSVAAGAAVLAMPALYGHRADAAGGSMDLAPPPLYAPRDSDGHPIVEESHDPPAPNVADGATDLVQSPLCAPRDSGENPITEESHAPPAPNVADGATDLVQPPLCTPRDSGENPITEDSHAPPSSQMTTPTAHAPPPLAPPPLAPPPLAPPRTCAGSPEESVPATSTVSLGLPPPAANTRHDPDKPGPANSPATLNVSFADSEVVLDSSPGDASPLLQAAAHARSSSVSRARTPATALASSAASTSSDRERGNNNNSSSSSNSRAFVGYEFSTSLDSSSCGTESTGMTTSSIFSDPGSPILEDEDSGPYELVEDGDRGDNPPANSAGHPPPEDVWSGQQPSQASEDFVADFSDSVGTAATTGGGETARGEEAVASAVSASDAVETESPAGIVAPQSAVGVDQRVCEGEGESERVPADMSTGGDCPDADLSSSLSGHHHGDCHDDEFSSGVSAHHHGDCPETELSSSLPARPNGAVTTECLSSELQPAESSAVSSSDGAGSSSGTQPELPTAAGEDVPHGGVTRPELLTLAASGADVPDAELGSSHQAAARTVSASSLPPPPPSRHPSVRSCDGDGGDFPPPPDGGDFPPPPSPIGAAESVGEEASPRLSPPGSPLASNEDALPSGHSQDTSASQHAKYPAGGFDCQDSAVSLPSQSAGSSEKLFPAGPPLASANGTPFPVGHCGNISAPHPSKPADGSPVLPAHSQDTFVSHPSKSADSPSLERRQSADEAESPLHPGAASPQLPHPASLRPLPPATNQHGLLTPPPAQRPVLSRQSSHDEEEEAGAGDVSGMDVYGTPSLSAQSSPMLTERQLRSSTSFTDLASGPVDRLKRENWQRADSH